jgi:glycosyltransferase involved in cell wall biosynthesis
MTPFGANIINTAFQSADLSVYAIVVSSKEINYADYMENNNYRIKYLNSSDNLIRKVINKFYNYKLLCRIKTIVKEHQINYIHFLTGDYTLNRIIPKLKKTTKIVYTVHDLEAHETIHKKLKEILFEKYILWGVKKNICNANILVTCSKSQFRQLKEKYPEKPVYFHQFPSLITANIVFGNDICKEMKDIGKYILFFGTVHLYKGIELLYNAFLENKILFDNYSLVIAGKGDLPFKRKNNEKKLLHINRFIKDSEVKLLYCNASCVIYPYLSATQSGVLTLAYKFGVPLIVSDISYFLDNVKNGETALVFKNQDKSDLTNKIEQLLFNTDLEEMKNSQKEYYEKNYSASSMLKELKIIYQK